MKKFVIKISLFVLVLFLFFSIPVFVILKMIPSQFDNSYQAELNDKYELLKSTDSKKIIYVGGSGGAFCVDGNKISERLGIPFINLALHGGFGYQFETEISKVNIQSGDLILLGYEEGNYFDDNSYNTDLIVTGINDNFELLRYLNAGQLKDFLSYLPNYLIKKLDGYLYGTSEVGGVYIKDAFNDYGTLTMSRSMLSKNERDNIKNVGYPYDSDLSDNLINYLSSYKTFIKEKDADLLLVYPAMYEQKLDNSLEELEIMEEKIENTVKIGSLFPIRESIFDEALMYDTFFHCNSSGQEAFTDLLINYLENYLKINAEESID